MMSIFLEIFVNNPSRETATAGLGNAEQYVIVLLALIIIAILIYLKRRNKK